MKTIEQMIFDLTIYELNWFSQNEDQIKDVAMFFSNGGFHVYSEKEIIKQWKLKIEEEVNHE